MHMHASCWREGHDSGAESCANMAPAELRKDKGLRQPGAVTPVPIGILGGAYKVWKPCIP